MTIELSRLLAAERATSPPARAAEVGLERLLTALAGQAAPLPVAVGTLKLGGSLVAKWIGIGFAVGLTGAGAATQVWAPAETPAAPSALVLASVPASATPLPSALEAAPLWAPSVSAAPESSPRSSGAAPAPGPEGAASASPTFDEELRLITRAKQELDTGRPHLAQVWLDEHRQRFPTGVFALDREGLSILARCSQRKNPALARDFAARHPGSPLVVQLQRKCGALEAAGSPTSSRDFSSPTNAPGRPEEPIKD
jgi:hypothetical protein